MKQILCGKIGDRIVLISKTSRYPLPLFSARHLISGKMNKVYQPLLASPHVRYFGNPNRAYAIFIGRVLKGALKVRYLLLGGAVGSGVTLQKKYEQWKEIVPDMSWLNDVFPNEEKWKDLRESVMTVKNIFTDKIEIDPRIKQLGEAKYKEYREWFNQRLDDAIKAAEVDQIQPGVDISSNRELSAGPCSSLQNA